MNTDQLTNVLDTDVLETIPEALKVDKIVGDLPGTIQDVLNTEITDQLTNVVGDLPGT